MTYDVGNPGSGLGQAQTCGRVKREDINIIDMGWKIAAGCLLRRSIVTFYIHKERIYEL
jgi:hypothetical protein